MLAASIQRVLHRDALYVLLLMGQRWGAQGRWRSACKVYLPLISIIRNLKVVIAVNACRLIQGRMDPWAVLRWPLGLKICPWAAELSSW